jgi:hypothetical protein
LSSCKACGAGDAQILDKVRREFRSWGEKAAPASLGKTEGLFLSAAALRTNLMLRERDGGHEMLAQAQSARHGVKGKVHSRLRVIRSRARGHKSLYSDPSSRG